MKFEKNVPAYWVPWFIIFNMAVVLMMGPVADSPEASSHRHNSEILSK